MAADFYDTLGVPRGASEGEIKSAYRRLAKQYHPDKNPGDEAAAGRFKEIGEAYATLSDPEKKALYDQFGGQIPGGFPGGAPPDFDASQMGDLNDIFANLFGAARGQGAGPGAGGAGGRPGPGGFSVNIEDLLSGMAGGRAGGAARPGAGDPFGDDPWAHTPTARPRSRPRLQGELALEFADAYGGAVRRVRIGGRDLDVTVPAGIRSGQKLQLAGQGPGGEDVVLTVTVRPDPRFAQDGDTLTTTVNVPAPLAAVGGSVRVPTPRGDVEVKVPAGTSSGRRLRVRGHGWPGKGGHGDLYARIELTVPLSPSERERELYAELLRLSGGG